MSTQPTTEKALGTYHRGYLVINRFPQWMQDNKRDRLRSAMCGNVSETFTFGYEARVMVLFDPLSVMVDPVFHGPLKELHLERANACFDVDVISVDVAFNKVKSVTSYKNIRFEPHWGNLFRIVTGAGHEVEVDVKNDHYQSLVDIANAG